jgi:hypothetical protein
MVVTAASKTPEFSEAPGTADRFEKCHRASKEKRRENLQNGGELLKEGDQKQPRTEHGRAATTEQENSHGLNTDQT